MSIEKDLEVKVDKILNSNSVSGAQKILGSKSGIVMISAISFIESALPLPILTDPFLVAAILVKKTNATKLVVITTLSSVVGGIFAFAIASLFLDSLLQIMSPKMMEEFIKLLDSGESNVTALTLVGAVTPVPYTIVAWIVAVIEGSLAVFIAASILGRG
ncbi:MAG: VTT domain-containing protein, partial [Candidatus Pacebacteria bacterium]|nr:VTT domain-containing protein [Candidatus Paceibacterota bacterium]